MRLNVIGRRTSICMAILLLVALACYFARRAFPNTATPRAVVAQARNPVPFRHISVICYPLNRRPTADGRPKTLGETTMTGNVVSFAERLHARASSSGYRSGRNSCREMPDARSTSSTRNGGTSSHCEIACAVTPISFARAACPPARSFARSKGDLSSMDQISSIALYESQATLHCGSKAVLYDAGMSIGKRITAARKRLGMTQPVVAQHFQVAVQAVSNWERDVDSPGVDRLMPLSRLLEVPVDWLLEGKGAPPAAKSEIVEIDIATLDPEQQAALRALAGNLRKRRGAA